MKPQSILVNSFSTPYDTAPFSEINEDEFLPSIIYAIQEAKNEVENIVRSTEEPSFKNTIEALEYSGELLGRITSIFFNLNAAETNENIQQIAQEVSPLLAEFSNDITLNEDLFKKVKSVYKNQTEFQLNDEQLKLLSKRYKSFVRNGANLSKEDKNILREIDKKLSQLSLKFGEHVLAATNAFELHVTEESDIRGLPDHAIEAAAQLAKSKNKSGWIFTLQYPSYIPFMTYCQNRTLRKEMAMAFGGKCFLESENNNQEIVRKIVSLRAKRAQLLGYKSHADFVLEERMAKTPENVLSFLDDLLEKAKPAAIKDFERLQTFADQKDGIKQIQSWDGSYYSEQLKKELFNLEEEKLKPYFKLENVINGVFEIAQRLFGLKFEKNTDIDVYHEDVSTYKVLDFEDNLVAIFYADFFPRKGKRNGAWMTSYKPQSIKEGKNERPHVSIVCNFTKPTKNKPSLLTFNEVTTLFHEFGHALHGMLANTTYPSLSGTSVHWDFVELPSQLFENWCYEKEALQLFAKHYETDEVIPMEYVERIKKAATFNEGLRTVRQISFGLLDMSWHAHTNPEEIENVKEHEKAAFEKTNIYPTVEETCMSTSFSHIFQGGYSSGYYSYKWAEVLDADAFEYFKQEGIFNKVVAKKFQDYVLSKGGTIDPMVLYKKFRGQEPKPEALLRRAGLLK
ncbi:MAG: M3 family metallopeptidase [bacterium]